MWKFLSESVRGTSHKKNGLPCQDSCITTELKGNQETFLVTAVADGAGSAEFSDAGAKIACTTIVHIITDYLLVQPSLNRIDRSVALNWCVHTRDTLIEHATANSISIRQLACTLLVAIIGESSAAFFQIGDGAIVVLRDGEYRHVFWPQHGEYANTTNFLTQQSLGNCLEFEFRDERVDEVAAFTDGIQSVALDYTLKHVHQPFFTPFFEALRPSGMCSDELILPLRQFLDSHPLNDRTDDDKTFVLATRVQLNEPAV